jgi:SAM-dependent MidA family methyltransferase
MHRALYGSGGFFVTGAPGAHFRTSAHASPLFAGAVARLLGRVDEALGWPERLDVLDVGAGRGELLVALRAAVAAGPAAGSPIGVAPLPERLRLTAVEVTPRPDHLPPSIAWRREPPPGIVGLLVATEWLDNVPLDIAAADEAGEARYVRTDDSLGERLSDEDARWVRRWWPLRPGTRAEVGTARDAAWAAAVSTLQRGLALAVDYGHLREERPPLGTLTGYRAGRVVPPVPDGSCDLTAHVAFDALAAATPGLPAPTLLRQRAALHALGVSGARPPLQLASSDPAGYVRGLATAGAAAELTDAAGLGSHFWLLQPVGIVCTGLRCET